MSERASEAIARREMPLDNIPKSLQPYWIWD
jgi:hypothetical protein